jgi:cyclase
MPSNIVESGKMNYPLRIVARLDVKTDNVIKGIRMEGLRKVGLPHDLAQRYYLQGADELLFIDSVASLYGRGTLFDVVRSCADEIFIPMTMGGGLQNLSDVGRALRSGADKVAINTHAVRRPQFIREIAEQYGSQCAVLSVHSKRTMSGSWEVMTDYGREHSGLDVLRWISEAVTLGVGEILLTSVDFDGTRLGYDTELAQQVTRITDVPVVLSGGFGSITHITSDLVGNLSGIAVGSELHYNRTTVSEVRSRCLTLGANVREV